MNIIKLDVSKMHAKTTYRHGQMYTISFDIPDGNRYIIRGEKQIDRFLKIIGVD